MSYQPVSLAELARFIAAEQDFDTRWRLVVEDMAGDGRELEAEEIRADLDTVSLCRSGGSW